MTDHLSEEAFEFEKYLIEDPQQWEIPEEIWAIYKKEDGPVGIAKHPEKGYAVLASCGQGPMILWKQPTQAELFEQLVAITGKLGWAVSIPKTGDDEEIPGLIMGIPKYVNGILEFVPENFSDRFKNE